MITRTIKIREKTLPSVDHYNEIKYPEDGFYLVKDKEGSLNDVLLYVGPQYEGGIRMVAYTGEWDAIKYTIEDPEDAIMPAFEGPDEPIHYTQNQLSENFALNMLSIALHGKKAE